jgi:di/tripeptidase
MYLADDAAGATNSLANMQAMSQNMKSLTALANSGGFAVSAEGGKALLEAIEAMMNAVQDSRADMDRITVAAKLGTSPDAQVITAYNQKVAQDSNGQSFAEALNLFQEVLVEAEAAIKKAMENYNEADATNGQSFKA